MRAGNVRSRPVPAEWSDYYPRAWDGAGRKIPQRLYNAFVGQAEKPCLDG